MELLLILNRVPVLRQLSCTKMLPLQIGIVQLIIRRRRVTMKVPQVAVTVAVTVKVPVSLNWCSGFVLMEVLFTPEAGSPKFQAIPDIAAADIKENWYCYPNNYLMS